MPRGLTDAAPPAQRGEAQRGSSRAGTRAATGLGDPHTSRVPPRDPRAPRRLLRLCDPSIVPVVSGDSTVRTATLAQWRPGMWSSAEGCRRRRRPYPPCRTGGGGTRGALPVVTPHSQPSEAPVALEPQTQPPSPSAVRVSGPWAGGAAPRLLMDHAQRPHDGQAALVLPNRHLPGVMPSPTPAVCGPSCPHPTCLSPPANLMGCHLCALRYRRVCPWPPCPDSPGWGLRTQPCSQGGRGFPQLVLAGPPEASCVLLACRGRSCKRPGCKTTWRLS